MADDTRTAGWYPDPWGTDDERYFDGSAWARDTRAAGSGGDAAPSSAIVASAAPAGSDPEGPVRPEGGESGPIPAGWHPDPWRLAAMRWWDGDAWTGHVSGPPPAMQAVDVQSERALARWLQPLLVVAGVAQAFGMFANAAQAKWFVEHWDEMVRTGTTVDAPPSGSSFSSLVLPITILVGVLFLVWFYRAARSGWGAGLPARRSPMLATLSFVIPVVNLWWPYQSAMDMVPADDRRRSVIQRWWAMWLLGTLCGLLIIPAQAVFDQTATRIVAGVGAAAMLAAAFAARSVVTLITDTHERRVQTAD
ncbi:MAG: DUF4328 domain-containing protein [Acidimicrobiia bacterium]